MCEARGDYAFLGAIGHGSSGSLRAALEKRSQKCVAIKSMTKGLRDSDLEKRRRESEILSKTSSPFIVSYYETFEDEDFLHLVMEFCEGGTLLDLIDSGQMTEERATFILTELACALAHIHNECNTIHRDLKPENIFLDTNGHVRLGDFGFCAKSDANTPMYRTACGSPAFVAPEIIKREEYTSKADIWSFGVVMYLALFHKLPFEGSSVVECMSNIVSGELEIPETVSEEARDLLTKVLEKDWHKRLSADDVLHHPWIQKGSLYRKIMTCASSRDELFGKLVFAGCAKEPEDVERGSVPYLVLRDNAITEHLGVALGTLRNGFRGKIQVNPSVGIYMRRETKKWHTCTPVPVRLDSHDDTQSSQTQEKCALVRVPHMNGLGRHRQMSNVMTVPRLMLSRRASTVHTPMQLLHQHL